MMLSPVVVGLFWKFMLDVQFGVVNSFLDSLGLGRVEWLTQQRLALLSLIIVDTWQWTPFIMLIALAGLTAVPNYLYEAAEIDRASEWFKFRRITLPLVWPLLLIAVMFRAIEAFRLFDLVYILTGGGPGGTTETLSYNVYKVAFFGFDTGARGGLRDPHGDRRHPRRAALPAIPQPTADALRWPHIQLELADAGSRASRRSARRRRALGSASRSLLTLFAVVVLFPVLWMLETALKETRTSTPSGQGDQLRPDARPSQGRLLVGLAGALGLQELGDRGRGVDGDRDGARRAVGVGLLALPHPAKKDQLFFILSTRFMPPVVVVIPIFLMFRDLGLLDTLQGLILVYAAFNLPFTIWMMKGFIDEVPAEYEEAAMLDGYSRFEAFWRVTMPLLVPASPPPRCSR